MIRYVDPVLLGVSDCLVLTALERAGARTLPRAARAGDRHTAYLRCPVDPTRVDRALDGAWQLAPMLATVHDLDVTSVAQWQQVLHDYTRALLLMSEPHSPARLRPHLHRLGRATPAARPYLMEVVGA